MKKTLFALAATLFLGGLHGQMTPFELADMEFTLLGKTIKYNRIQFIDPTTNAIEQQVDILWDANRKVLQAQDSSLGSTAYYWMGNPTAHSNTVALLYGQTVYGENQIYWDQQFRDTLIVDFRDTNNDGTPDKTMALRYAYGPHGIDYAYLLDYAGGSENLILSFITYRNSSGMVDSMVSYYHVWGLSIPAIAYYYQYNGSFLSQVNLVSKLFWNAPIMLADLTYNSAGEITAALISEYDSATTSWQPQSQVVFSMESIFGREELAGIGKIDFYPNPASDWIEVRSISHGKLEIIGMDGKTLLEAEINASLNHLNIDHLAPGNYLLRFSNARQEKSLTLSKK